MYCYFLNARQFVSKAGKTCSIFTIASPDGFVSEFFISDDLYQQAVDILSPFDYIDLSLSALRGKFTVFGFHHAVRPD